MVGAGADADGAVPVEVHWRGCWSCQRKVRSIEILVLSLARYKLQDHSQAFSYMSLFLRKIHR
jgi:hypothetical protein